MDEQFALVETDDRDPQNYNAYLKVRIISLVPGGLLNSAEVVKWLKILWIRFNPENTRTANVAFRFDLNIQSKRLCGIVAMHVTS